MHCFKQHPNIAASLIASAKRAPNVVVQKLPRGSRSVWRCPLCPKGIAQPPGYEDLPDGRVKGTKRLAPADRESLARAKKAHLQADHPGTPVTGIGIRARSAKDKATTRKGVRAKGTHTGCRRTRLRGKGPDAQTRRRRQAAIGKRWLRSVATAGAQIQQADRKTTADARASVVHKVLQKADDNSRRNQETRPRTAGSATAQGVGRRS